MKDTLVPPPPLGTVNRAEGTQSGQNVPAPRNESPLDAAFLGRTYRSMAWFGVVVTVLAAFQWKSGILLGSFIGGYLLAVVLLRLQEVTLGGLLRPKEQLGGMDPRLGVLLLLPLKFVGVGIILVIFNMTGLLKPIPMGVGFFAAQIVIIAKLLGWMMTRSTVRK